MQALVALACGVVFGAGLAISGMTNPAKVLGFLDVAGDWDPTLVFVMGGALAVSSLGYALVRRTARPWLAPAFQIPTRRDFDAQLVAGAVLFGVGWGLVGLCPGPAIANLARGSDEIAISVASMCAGVFAHRLTTLRRSPRPGATAPAPTR